MLFGRTEIGKIPWLQLLAEAIVVISSVLLALTLNSWREGQANEALAKQGMRNLEHEILQNKAEIEAALSYHRLLLDSLESNNPPKGISTLPASIQNHAWAAAQSSGASTHCDFGIAAIAAKIEETQRQYQHEVAIVSEILLRGNFEGYNKKRVQDGLRVVVRVLIVLEKKMLQMYTEGLKTINAS